jgi:hypothetical protein
MLILETRRRYVRTKDPVSTSNALRVLVANLRAGTKE